MNKLMNNKHLKKCLLINKDTMREVLFFVVIFVNIVSPQFVDTYGIYSNYTNPSVGFYKAGICKCENSLIYNPNDFSGIQEINIGNYYTFNNNTILVKINVSNTSPLNVFTDHINTIKYSLDNVEWSNDYKGQFYTCNFTGFLILNIRSTVISTIRVYASYGDNCSSGGNNDTIITTKIRGFSMLEYTVRGFGFSTFLYSKTPGCDLSTFLYYTGTNNNRYNYSIGSSYAQSVSYSGTYLLSFYITPSIDIECDLIIHFSDLIYNGIYTSPVLFYNNTQIIEYLLLNKTYDPNFQGTINLDGGTSINSGVYPIKNLNNSQVYLIFKEYDLLENVSYFQPLLNNYGDYLETTVNIDSRFNFTQDLIINMSTVNLSVAEIPVNITLSNSNISLLQNTSIKGIEFQGNNTIIGNSTIFITGSANLSGVLNLDFKNNSNNDSHVIMVYNSSNGEFSEIKAGDNCTDTKPKYTNTQLSVEFSLKKSCQQGADEEFDGVLYYVVIPIVVILVILVIIIVILIVKVPSIRKRVFPHRDRPYYIDNKNYTIGGTGSDIENAPVAKSISRNRYVITPRINGT